MVARQEDHFAADGFALADVGRLNKADVSLRGGKRQTAGRFGVDDAFELGAGQLRHANVLHEELT